MVELRKRIGFLVLNILACCNLVWNPALAKLGLFGLTIWFYSHLSDRNTLVSPRASD